MKKMLLTMTSLFLSGCLGMPEKVAPVSDFEINRYLGTWYEIARLDHSFERGLTQVTANYSLREDGGVSVVNRGFLRSKGVWKEVEGKAYFVNSAQEAYLKVSFFGPFYGSYVVFELDKENYQYAFVSGPDLSYLWLLSRSPDPDQEMIERFKREVKKRGFNTEELILVEHR